VAAFGETARKRMRLAGPAVAAVALGGWAFAGAAHGAGAAPSMEVLPKATGLKYAQTVEIKGHHLPKGSGSVAATICGLNDASGKAIAKPTADDCAGASEIGKLVVVKSWQSNGEFDTKYTLPKSGQKFGKHARFCDKKHFCALVVADANPNAPAYHVDKKIQFVDQAPASPSAKPKTTTTKPSTPTTKPNNSTHPMPPLAPVPNTVPAPVAQGLDQVCTTLAAAVKQAGGDASALLAACSAIESGNGPQQLAAVLQSPSLLCIEGASAWQNNAQVTDACNQAAAALAPATSQLGGLLGPLASGS
jgi:hypothetical protein